MDNTANSQGPDAAIIIGKHLARTGFADLPVSVVKAVKESILDTIGCAIAGTSGPDIAALRDLVTTWAGQQAATIIGGQGLKVPAYAATLANAALVHQDDFDDTYDSSPCHPTSATLMAALALAEERGDIGGQDLITAVALGNDLMCRIAQAITGRMDAYPWFRAPVIGIFGATASCARILGADAGQHVNALGLALPQASGTWASVHHPGSSVRAIRDGLAYKNAVLAAQLAMHGVRGDAHVLDGPYGFYQAFFRGDYDRSQLLDGLGETWLTDRISLKPWPSCRHVHATLTAVLALREQHNLCFEDIEDVLLHVGDINADRCWPVATGMIPGQRIDLLCNLPFAVGVAIKHGGMPLNIYRNAEMADDVIRTSVPKVRWTHDPLQNGPWSLEPGRVEIRTTRGALHHHHAPLALGHPDHRMSEAHLRTKFMDCLTAGANPVAPARGERIIDIVLHLEQVEDLGELVSLLH
jgi:2-methylcitrate dehydratase PrpD